jgi:signal transduction histidine kinase
MAPIDPYAVVLLGADIAENEALGVDARQVRAETSEELLALIHEHTWPVVIASSEQLGALPSGLQCVMLVQGPLGTQPCHRRVIGHMADTSNEQRHQLIAALNLRKELATYDADLKHAADELDDFVHTVGHDLKSPIQGIMGLAGLLMEQTGTRVFPALAKFAERIESDAEHLSEMISALTRFARLGRGDDKLAEAVELATILDHQSARLIGEHSDLIIGFQFDRHLGVVWAKAELVELIIGEVLDNCVRFRSERPPVIKATFEMSQDGEHGVLTIADNGVGMSTHGLSSALQMFTRLDRKRSTGVGAGLTLARRAAQLSGGDLTLTSVEGEGTSVSISLPASPN